MVFSGDFRGRDSVTSHEKGCHGALSKGIKVVRGARPGTKNQIGHVNLKWSYSGLVRLAFYGRIREDAMGRVKCLQSESWRHFRHVAGRESDFSGASGNTLAFPEVPPGDFPGTSLTVDLFPGNFPDFPGSSPEVPGP